MGDAEEKMMRKHAYFDSEQIEGWPRSQDIKRYFLPQPDQPWPFAHNDTAGFYVDGIDGTEHRQLGEGRIDVRLRLCAHPTLGLLLIWSKRGVGSELTYTSKGDLNRLQQFIRTQHD